MGLEVPHALNANSVQSGHCCAQNWRGFIFIM